MTPPEHNTELVSVPVPRSRLEEVYRLLGSPPADSRADSTGPADTDTSDWTKDDFAAIAKDQRPSFAVVRQMLDVLAESPDDEVSMTEVCSETGHTREEIRGALSGFGRTQLAKKNGSPWSCWLVTADGTETTTELSYALSSTAAQRWQEARH